MSLVTLKKEKTNKPFKKYDLIIYFVLAIIILSLFLGFVVFKDNKQSDGIEIILDETIIMTYYYNNDKFLITDKYQENLVVENLENGYKITVFCDDTHNHYNIIMLNNEQKKVTVLDANCSIGKDCTKMEINGGSGSIVCVPHKLKVKPISAEIDQPISG